MGNQGGVGAATVVAQLRAFARDRASQGALYAQGRNNIDGAHVMRFARGKFSPELTAELTVAERDSLRRAARLFVREVCLREGATHYQVLSVGPGTPPEEIERAYHFAMALIHPDRCDVGESPWPSDSAQRVNGAYAVLGDDTLRREYDQKLAALREATPVRTLKATARPPMRKPPASRRTVAIRGLVALAFVAVAFALLALREDMPNADSALLRGWTRPQAPDRNTSPGGPRFLAAAVPASATLPQDASPVTLQAPHALNIEAGRTNPSRAPMRVEIPDPLAHIEAPRSIVPVDMPVVAAITSARAANAPAVSPRDMEDLAAKLIDSYEAGDADRLLALMDTRLPGEIARMRQEYTEFFRATAERHLHVNRVEWRPVEEGVHARGSAVVSAQYSDGRAPLQRNVDFELDVVPVAGHVRISRLSVSPQQR